jgi:signal peptidase I
MIQLLVAISSLNVSPMAAVRRTVPFPKRVLEKVVENNAVPGTAVESPPFVDDGGHLWQVVLYPFGGNADPNFSGRVGVYLRSLDAQSETDATFTMGLRVLPSPDALESIGDDASRGLTFKCGMTFCTASEAGESVGRCEDWGAHVYATDLLLAELQEAEESIAAVEIEIAVWEQRRCARGASLKALANQVARLPTGSMRVGEVVVALPEGGTPSTPTLSTPTPLGNDDYRPVAGVEYRVMRLVTPEGLDVFAMEAGCEGVAYLLPTSRAAREEGRFESNEDTIRTWYSEKGGGRFGQALGPGSSDASRGATEVTWGAGTRWPVAVPMASLPPLASRLGFRALPARLGYVARTNLRVLAMLVIIGASPLWAGYGLSQLGSLYAIPTRSMEATLRVGDVVLAEKSSRWLARRPLEREDLVLFRAPSSLLQLVADAGGRPIGSRDLFVKRVAAIGGDVVELSESGGVVVNGVARAPPTTACSDADGRGSVGDGDGTSRRSRTVPDGEVFVLGDCPARSTDSRSWGTLPLENVVARPVVRVWPPERSGAVS